MKMKLEIIEATKRDEVILKARIDKGIAQQSTLANMGSHEQPALNYLKLPKQHHDSERKCVKHNVKQGRDTLILNGRAK